MLEPSRLVGKAMVRACGEAPRLSRRAVNCYTLVQHFATDVWRPPAEGRADCRTARASAGRATRVTVDDEHPISAWLAGSYEDLVIAAPRVRGDAGFTLQVKGAEFELGGGYATGQLFEITSAAGRRRR